MCGAQLVCRDALFCNDLLLCCQITGNALRSGSSSAASPTNSLIF